MKINVFWFVKNRRDFRFRVERMGTLDMECALRNYLARKGQEPYVAVIHRFDQPVQGILVFAKDRQMQQNSVNKCSREKLKRLIWHIHRDIQIKKQEVLINELEKDGKTNTSKVVLKKTQNSKRENFPIKF